MKALSHILSAHPLGSLIPRYRAPLACVREKSGYVPPRPGPVRGPIATEADFPPPPPPPAAALHYERESLSIDLSGDLSVDLLGWDRENRARQSALDRVSTQNLKADRLLQLIEFAVKSGNIEMAMLLFSGSESRAANEMARTVVEKMQELREARRAVSAEMAQMPAGEKGSRAIAQLQQRIQDIDTDMGVYQSIVKDVMQQKESAVELASTVMTMSHNTAMSVLRR